MKVRRDERRTHDRHAATLEFRGVTDGGDTIARMTTKDLSLGGVYCTSSNDFPEMTRLAVRLMLPDRSGNGGPEPLDAQAVVVRRRPVFSAVGRGRYELALFFTSMDDADRQRLARFLAVA